MQRERGCVSFWNEKYNNSNNKNNKDQYQHPGQQRLNIDI